MNVMDNWVRRLALMAAVAGAAGMSIVMLEAPAMIGFALSVGLACGWCYWLERRSSVS